MVGLFDGLIQFLLHGGDWVGLKEGSKAGARGTGGDGVFNSVTFHLLSKGNQVKIPEPG